MRFARLEPPPSYLLFVHVLDVEIPDNIGPSPWFGDVRCMYYPASLNCVAVPAS